MTPRDSSLATARLRLRARTELVEDAGRLLDHLGPGGAAWLTRPAETADPSGFVTAGTAAEVAPHDAVAVLGAIEHVHPAGAPATIGPRAVGALPFAGGGRLVVPGCIVTREPDGRTWRTTIDGAGALPPLHAAAATSAPIRSIESLTDLDAWRASVGEILALIAAGHAEKVVLAREVVVDARQHFDLHAILQTLLRTQPGCVVYADHGFAGASPELLVRRTGRNVRCRPMAGTGPDAAALVGSDKDAREHALVVDAVLDALAPTCDGAVVQGPAPVALADVAHLATTITARLRDADVSAVDLALALHPTPAVAGTPRAVALDAIRRLEPTPRGLYAGPCGWVDANGDGEFVVALRGAQIDGSRARLHAGAGIVAGSDPDTEWAETQAKLEPMLRALTQ